MKNNFLLAMIACTAVMVFIAAPAHAGLYWCYSCDAVGNSKDTFHYSDTVYVKGQVKALQKYTIYVVPDDLRDLAHVLTTTSLDLSTGYSVGDWFGPISIWVSPGPANVGTYDIWIDDGDGKYDEGDYIDSCTGITGFFVIPETPLGTIAVLLATFATVLLKRKRI